MYSITNIMFHHQLFVNKITWTGGTKAPGEIRVASRGFTNIMKLVHAIMRSYDCQVKLHFVEDFFHKTLCIFGKKRAGNQGKRSSVSKLHNAADDRELPAKKRLKYSNGKSVSSDASDISDKDDEDDSWSDEKNR